MGRNNNNAGMHFVRHSKNSNYDDLAYYDRNSMEGIQNRRYEALAQLEAMGDFAFTKQIAFINVLIMNADMEYPVTYRVYLYDKDHEKDIRKVSTMMRLCESKDETKEILVRVHDEQRVIYLENESYRDNMLSKNKEYKLLRK